MLTTIVNTRGWNVSRAAIQVYTKLYILFITVIAYVITLLTFIVSRGNWCVCVDEHK